MPEILYVHAFMKMIFIKDGNRNCIKTRSTAEGRGQYCCVGKENQSRTL